MASGFSLGSAILRAREQLRRGREKIRERHEAKVPGIQISTLIADLYDSVVLGIWDEVVSKHAGDPRLGGIALIAHGGFGRRDLAPYSDVDLMLLARRKSAAVAEEIAADLSRDLVDAGLDVGFSIRTPAEACSLAWSDPVIFSSLTESRWLAGNLHAYSHYFESLRKGVRRRRERLMKDVVAARREERHKWGETNFLLRPNVKRSRGALRDIQLIRWLGFARYGENDLERLVKLGALPAEDYRQLRQAYTFMLRLRNELHFREQRSQDVLDRPTQMEIAEGWGYQGTEGVLPVEHFMQDYFEHTRNVRYAASFFTEDSLVRPIYGRALERALSRRIDAQIRMGPTQIWVHEKSQPEFAKSLPDVLRLIYLANHHRRRISHSTWQAIRHSMLQREPIAPDPESISYFIGLLSQPGRLPALLRRLHELRVLEQLIPAMKRCRGLLQFNVYHKYTVDAHCIRAVEAATDMEDEPSPMGRRYRRLKDKTLLHLALLIHDLGKGYEEDHCEVGRRIAKETAELFEFDEASSETLQWLIHKHLEVNVVAFRHDLNDGDVVHAFAAEVASIRRLELLIVHSVADLKAVGPGVATEWKMNLIEDLYRRTRRYFETGHLPGEDDPEMDAIRQEITQRLQQQEVSSECLELLNSLPLSILKRDPAEKLVDQLSKIDNWLRQHNDTWCTGQFDPSVAAMRYTIVRKEESAAIGTFARATAALSSSGLKIMRANIETVGENLAWDDFWVIDPESDGATSPHRIQATCERVCHLLDTPDAPLPAQRRTWTTRDNQEPDSVNVLPTKVTFDNETLDRYTILSLFAYDQTGLLYRVATALAQNNLVLHFAKIDTHLDQIADVFYVTELDGRCILDAGRQAEIRQAILEATH